MKPFIHFGIISVMLMDAMLVYVLTIFCLAQSLQNSLRQVVLIAMFAGGKKQAITPRYGLKWPTNNDRIIQTLYFFECPVWYRLAVLVCNSHTEHHVSKVHVIQQEFVITGIYASVRRLSAS